MSIVALDIGGSTLRIAKVGPKREFLDEPLVFDIGAVTSVNEAIAQVCANSKPDAVAVAFAAPISGDRVELTNYNLTIDASSLTKEFQCPTYLVNDLVAGAWGLFELEQKDQVSIQGGQPDPNFPRALMAVGTGLGETIALQLTNGASKQETVLSAEAGHCDFAPLAGDAEFFHFLASKYPQHVSWERVLSGLSGFQLITDYLLQSHPRPDWLESSPSGGLGEVIAERFRTGDPLASAVVKKFMCYYGAEAGNLALRTHCQGGLYLAGGIAQKNLNWFDTKDFLDSFSAKGRFSDYMKRIPISIITDPFLNLWGAAYFAINQK